MAHSHDGIDWDEHLQRLRGEDELVAPETARLARTLLRPSDRHVVDVGAGAGGSAAAFAAALAESGGVVTIVDSAPELLAEAVEHARSAAVPGVEIRSVVADLAAGELGEITGGGQADLVFAARVVHHLPDQLDGLRRLAGLLAPGGRLVVREGGLSPQVLPWDVGLSEPGLELRLQVARDKWFREMRADMDRSRRLITGWAKALSEIGLVDAHSFSYLVDRQAPVAGAALAAVLRRLEWLRHGADDRVAAEDLDAIDALRDPDSPHYAGKRDDVHYLAAHSVHVATLP